MSAEIIPITDAVSSRRTSVAGRFHLMEASGIYLSEQCIATGRLARPSPLPRDLDPPRIEWDTWERTPGTALSPARGLINALAITLLLEVVLIIAIVVSQ